MDLDDALSSAETSQIRTNEAHVKWLELGEARNAAIVLARASGASAIQISDRLGLSRQQVHKILDASAKATTVTQTLRDEVITSGLAYEDLLEDDQMFVDWQVAQLAKDRGIELA